jgi:hypothetical protein
MSITIRHTVSEGTLVDGTARGDGSAEILRRLRFLEPESRCVVHPAVTRIASPIVTASRTPPRTCAALWL